MEDSARYRAALLPPALHVRGMQVSPNKHCHEGQEGLSLVTVTFLTDISVSSGDLEQILSQGTRKLAEERG